MAFDGFVTRSVVHELAAKLVSGRISKIYQPHQSDIILVVRARGENCKLLISANPSFPRIHMTNENYSNPLEPPMFCMLMRKHCEGGIIEGITQVDAERIIHIDVRTRDELGDEVTRRIVIEIMGRHSNIILLDASSNTILDSVHHVTPAVSQYRIVMPGRKYVNPPDQEKMNPFSFTRELLRSHINPNTGKMDQQLVGLLTGMSPLIAKELLTRAGMGGLERLWEVYREFISQMEQHHYVPTIVATEQKTVFSIIPLTHLERGEQTTFDSISPCLEEFFHQRAERDTVRQRVHDLSRLIGNEHKKNEKKLEKLKAEFIQAEDADHFRLIGDLLMANLHLLKKGDKEAEIINYFEEETPMTKVPLDPFLTPSENAQAYYKKYNKAKASLAYISDQISKTEEELSYLEALLQQLESASVTDIDDIREELAEEGYIRNRNKNKRKKNILPAYSTYWSRDGIEIVVGKNNKQNEYVTNKLANPFETWLHTKDIPGSHVIIRSRNVTDQALHDGAMIAAYFSKAKNSSSVPVDYTLVKHVKKPNGAKPGFVTYDNQKTIIVTPDELLIKQLEKKPIISEN